MQIKILPGPRRSRNVNASEGKGPQSDNRRHGDHGEDHTDGTPFAERATRNHRTHPGTGICKGDNISTNEPQFKPFKQQLR